MAKVKQTYKTPLLPLSWVTVRGEGKLKKKNKPEDPDQHNYLATVTFPDEPSMLKAKAVFDKFWRENKPKGIGKQKYELIKPVMVPTLDDKGKEMFDEDDEIIKHHNGQYTLTAKTATTWPDGNTKVVKLLGSNGKELPEGHKLENGCGIGTLGIIHGTLSINEYEGNEGLQLFLNGVQIKDSSFVEYVGGDGLDEVEEIEDDVADAEVDTTDGPDI